MDGLSSMAALIWRSSWKKQATIGCVSVSAWRKNPKVNKGANPVVEFIPSEKQLTEEEAALNEVRGTYEEKYGFHDSEKAYNFKSQKGLNAEIVRQISEMKNEPAWMLEERLKPYEIFLRKPMPTWGADLSGINF